MERLIIDDYRELCYLTDEQVRAYITVYCIENDIIVDTSSWDYLIYDIYSHYYSGNLSLEEFDMFMSGDLI